MKISCQLPDMAGDWDLWESDMVELGVCHFFSGVLARSILRGLKFFGENLRGLKKWLKILRGLKIYAIVPFKGSKIIEKSIIRGLKFLSLCIRSMKFHFPKQLPEISPSFFEISLAFLNTNLTLQINTICVAIHNSYFSFI